MSLNNFYTQNLQIKYTKSVYIKNYRLPYSQKEEVRKQVNNLLICKYPLPRIENILDRLGRAKYFSVIDLYSGFHQVPFETNSRDTTSFSTDEGSFRWKVLPFGLNISSNSFSRMMNLAFPGLPPDKMFVYIDDIIITGCSEAHHVANLEDVFAICRKSNLKINPEKCQFFRSQVTFLGHICSNSGILPDTSKIRTVENYPKPHDKESVKRFVAFTNYYKKIIKNFAVLAAPLNKLTRKNISFQWTKEANDAFDKLKDAIIKPPILQYPDFTKEFTVTVDASQFGCGAVLSQNNLPISFASKSIDEAACKKSTVEQELLAIHFAVLHFKPYLYGTHFQLQTDHKPLLNLKDPSSKLTRLR